MWGAAPSVSFDAVLVGGGDALADAVTLAGGLIVARVGWAEALPVAAGALVLLDASRGDEEGLARALPDLAPYVDVALFGRERIDLVAGALLFTDAALLCEPSPTELIAALAVAAQSPDMAAAGVREGEAARLRRMGEEVARIAGVLARLAATEGAGPEADDVADRRPAYDAGPVAIGDTGIDAPAIRAALRARRLRDGFFGDGLFEEPAWDMLLDLFAAELEGARVSVSSLCIAAAVAPTTALRWIVRMTDEGLFERRPDPHDRRRAFMALSPRGAAAMRGYVAALGRAGLSIG